MSLTRWLVWTGLLCGAANLQAETTIWKLAEPDTFSGHRIETAGKPRLTSDASGTSLEFDGVGDGLLVADNPLAGLSEFTIELRFKPAGDGPEEQRIVHFQDEKNNRGLLEIRLHDGRWAFEGFLLRASDEAELTLLDPQKSHSSDRWTWVAVTFKDGRFTSYVDGVRELAGEIGFPVMSAGQVSLGMRQNRVSWFKGGIAEVRWHSEALASGKLQRD